jgi:hypothetical protein
LREKATSRPPSASQPASEPLVEQPAPPVKEAVLSVGPLVLVDPALHELCSAAMPMIWYPEGPDRDLVSQEAKVVVLIHRRHVVEVLVEDGGEVVRHLGVRGLLGLPERWNSGRAEEQLRATQRFGKTLPPT